MDVRVAKPTDAEKACLVLRRSIEELCFPDHGGDPATLQKWLANKTPENVLSWIKTPDQRLIVAVEANEILGVGAATAAGEILLNYVSPEARFRGVSKRIMHELERYLREQGNLYSRLCSGRTAHAFYQALGYEDSGAPEERGRQSSQPMVKRL